MFGNRLTNSIFPYNEQDSSDPNCLWSLEIPNSLELALCFLIDREPNDFRTNSLKSLIDHYQP